METTINLYQKLWAASDDLRSQMDAKKRLKYLMLNDYLQIIENLYKIIISKHECRFFIEWCILYKLGDIMLNLLNNEENEKIAIEYLKKYDSRYKNLEKLEKPDFISYKDSIGVEVTVVEFDDFIKSFIYKDKTLKEYTKMKGIKPVQKKDFEAINKVINGKYTSDVEDDLNKFIDSYYYKKGNEILELQSINQYKKLDPNTNLYPKSSFPNKMIIDGQRIIGFLPSSFWVGKIVDKYINAVKEKNQLLKNYRKFDENSLLIINYTAGIEESLEFERRIREIDGINFDKIFVLNGLFDNQIYEINLNNNL